MIDGFVLWLCEGLLRLIGRHSLANLVGRDSVEPTDEPWRQSGSICTCGSASPLAEEHLGFCPYWRDTLGAGA